MDKQQYEEMQVERFRRAAACTLERERINTTLRRRVWGAALVFVLGGVGVAGCLARTTTPAVEAPVAVLREAPPSVWATDGEVADAGPIGRALPNKPFSGQKSPPCTKALQVEINGGCWVALEVRPSQLPGCGPDYFEHGGKCYLPVQQAKRLPTSIEP